MQLVAEHFHTGDGRVNYRKFCDLMEHSKIEIITHCFCLCVFLNAAFNVPQLEKKPTEVVQRPARGHLLQVCQVNCQIT